MMQLKGFIFSCLFRGNIQCKILKQYCRYSTLLSTNRNILNSIFISIDKDFSKTDHYQFYISQECDELLKSLSSFKSNKDQFDSYSQVRANIPTIFRTFITKEYGGDGMNHTNFAYLLENLRSNTDISYLMMVNQLLVAQAIIKYGNKDQKSKYLPKLTSGQAFGSFCLHELSSGNNISMMEGYSETGPSADTILITAKKNWIFNAQHMNMCIVFVKMKDENGVDCISAFVKDEPLKDPNIHVSNCENVLNISNVGDVIFDKVVFSRNDMIGNVGDGFKIAIQLQNNARFAIAASLLGIIKDGLHHIEHLRSSSPIVNDKISHWLSDVFAVESGLYFTTNLTDDYPNSTFDSEFAVLKIQASKTAFEVISGCIDLARLAGENDAYYASLMDKVRGLELFLGSNDVLTHFVGSVALQYNLPMMTDSLLKLHNGEDNLSWLLQFKKIRYEPSYYLECDIDKNIAAVKAFLYFLRKDTIQALHVYGYNSPNQDFIFMRLGNCFRATYHLLAVIGHYNSLEKAKLSNDTRLLIKCSMDTLRREIIDTIGVGFDRLQSYSNYTKYKAISKIVTKNKVHGIESAIARNW